MSYIDWELAEHAECYKRLRCNRVIDEMTLTHVICNVCKRQKSTGATRPGTP